MSVRGTAGLLLFALAGCAGFEPATPEALAAIPLPPAPASPGLRVRMSLDLDSPWLSGTFEGVMLASRGRHPRLRLQLFPDLGPKAVDLWAAPDRIAGYFGGTKEGVDCALPSEAALHPLTLMGVTLVEHAATLDAGRVEGLRRSDGGWELSVPSVVPGAATRVGLEAGKGITTRSFRWLHGVSWDWRRTGEGGAEITAPSIRVKIRIHEARDLDRLDAGLLEPAVPPDVVLRKGTAKPGLRR